MEQAAGWWHTRDTETNSKALGKMVAALAAQTLISSNPNIKTGQLESKTKSHPKHLKLCDKVSLQTPKGKRAETARPLLFGRKNATKWQLMNLRTKQLQNSK